MTNRHICSGADSCRDLISVGNHTRSLQWHQRCSTWVPTDLFYGFCILPSLPLKRQCAFVPNSSNLYRRLPLGVPAGCTRTVPLPQVRRALRCNYSPLLPAGAGEVTPCLRALLGSASSLSLPLPFQPPLGAPP